MRKRLLAWILALLMIVSIFPVSAYAEEEQNDEETAAAAEETVESDLPETADYEMAGPAVPQSEEEADSEAPADAAVEGQDCGSDHSAEGSTENEAYEEYGNPAANNNIETAENGEAGSEVLADAAVEGQDSGSDYTDESIPEDEKTTQTGYTVSFDLRGHGETIEAVTIQEGETLARPADPAAEGFVFGGWYSDADCSSRFDFEQTVITEDLTLYAGWTEEAPEAEETEPEAEYPAFEQVRTINGVTVTVKAGEGVFPEGAELSVEQVPVYQAVEDAVEAERDENRTVAVSYTFDIKVINPETWEEYQPADGQTVSVSFALAEVADENLETNIYHVTEDEDSGAMTAESLEVTQEITPETGEETTAVVETEGFSYYQVEFTYEKKQYVLPGNESVTLSEILETVGLNGEATEVTVSTPELFSADLVNGEWIVTPHQAFTTEEWMKVTLNSVVYEITVTDAVVRSGTCGPNLTWNLDDEGTLTISGTGEMNNYSYYSSVPWYSFRTEIKEAVLTSGVTSISSYAFYYCSSLTSLEIPEGVTSIGGSAFINCDSMTTVNYGGTETARSVAVNSGRWKTYENDSLYNATWQYGTTVIELASGDCGADGNNLTWVLMADGTMTISGNGDMANSQISWYNHRQSITSVTMNSGVTSIGYDAFNNCSGLTSVTIPASVTSIGYGAFNNCSGLTSVTIPASVTSIGINVFFNCSKLKTAGPIESESNIQFGWTETIPAQAFYGCSSLTSITIPEGVTSIGSSAFNNCSGLTSVTIPASVTSIGSNVFSNCSKLKTAGPIESESNIQFGWTETIPAQAFYGCSSLTSITIPEGVMSIGYSAFSSCSSLTSITIPEGVTSIGNSAFYNCSGLTSIMLPENVTDIGSQAFYNCSKLKSIIIPDGVTSIWYHVFYGCSSLESITIPANVTSIYNDAFWGCRNVAEVYYGASESRKNALLAIGCNYDYNTDTYFGWGSDSDGTLFGNATWHYAETEPGWDFCGNSLFWNYDSTSNTLTIKGSGEMWEALEKERYSGNYAMPWSDHNSDIIKVLISPGITVISNRAFANMPYLQEFSLPDSLITIGDYAFQSDIRLTSFAVPSGVTTIGSHAFDQCSRLGSVTLPDTVTSIGEYAFNYCSKLTNISIPNGITAIERYTFYYCNNMTNISLPDSLESIGDSAFGYCSRLADIPIPSGVNTIGQSAFSGCSSLTSITIPEGVMSIGYSAFSSCSSLTSITIPEGVTSIGNSAFYNCSKLETVILPDGLKNIGGYAFSWCNNLTDIRIPLSVRNIDSYAFQNVPIVYYQGTAAQWEMVYNLAANENFTSMLICLGDTPNIVAAGRYGNNITWILDGDVLMLAGSGYMNEPSNWYDGDGRDNGTGTESSYPWYTYRKDIKKIVIGDGIMRISAYAFRFSNAEEVVFPDGLESISVMAFNQCYNLTSVNFPDSLTSIGDCAFISTAIKSFHITPALTSIGDAAFSTFALETITVAPGNTKFYVDANGILYDKSHSGKIWTSQNTYRSYSNQYVLMNCPSSLSGRLTVNDSVTYIAPYAFAYCSKMTAIEMPADLRGVGHWAFAGCSKLNEIKFKGGPPTFSNYAFNTVTATAYYPANKGWTAEKMQNCGGALSWTQADSPAVSMRIYALTNNQSIIVQFDKEVPGCTDAANYTVKDARGQEFPLSYAGSAYAETKADNSFKLNFYNPLQAGEYYVSLKGANWTSACSFDISLSLSIYRIKNTRNVIIQLNEPIIGCTTAENYVMHTLDGEMIPITSAVSAFQEIGGEAPNVFRLTTAKALQPGTTYVVETRGMSWHGEACQGTIAYFTPEAQAEREAITIHALTNNQSIIVKFDKEVNGCTEKDNYIVTGSNGTVYPLSYAGSAYGETHVANTFKLNFHNPLPADIFQIRTQNMSVACEGDFEILLNLSVYRFVDRNNVIIQLNEPIIGCTTAENYVMHTLSGEEIKITSAVSAFQEIGGEAPNVFRLTTAKDLQRGTTYVVETRGMSWNGKECQGTIAYITP